jgi:hypothetical protein
MELAKKEESDDNQSWVFVMKQSLCISCVFFLFFSHEVSNCHGTVKKKEAACSSTYFYVQGTVVSKSHCSI